MNGHGVYIYSGTGTGTAECEGMRMKTPLNSTTDLYSLYTGIILDGRERKFDSKILVGMGKMSSVENVNCYTRTGRNGNKKPFM